MKSWQSAIACLDRLIKGSGNRSWEIARKLRQLWNDRDFLSQCCNGDHDEARRYLEKYAQSIGRHVNDLLQMIEHFPNKADWKDGELVALYDETCRRIIAKRLSARGGEPITRHRVSWAQYEALQKKYRAAQAEIRRLRKLVAKGTKLAKVA